MQDNTSTARRLGHFRVIQFISVAADANYHGNGRFHTECKEDYWHTAYKGLT